MLRLIFLSDSSSSAVPSGNPRATWAEAGYGIAAGPPLNLSSTPFELYWSTLSCRSAEVALKFFFRESSFWSWEASGAGFFGESIY